MAIIGNHQQSMAIIGNHQQSMAIIGNHQQSMAIIGNHPQSSAIIGNQWQSSAIKAIWAIKNLFFSPLIITLENRKGILGNLYFRKSQLNI